MKEQYEPTGRQEEGLCYLYTHKLRKMWNCVKVYTWYADLVIEGKVVLYRVYRAKAAFDVLILPVFTLVVSIRPAILILYLTPNQRQILRR